MAKSKEEPTIAEQLQSLLGQATAEDVAEIDAAIDAKEAEIAGLRQTRKLLAVAAGVEEPVKRGGWPRKKKAEPESNGHGKPAAAATAGGNNPWTAPKTMNVLDDRRKKVVELLRSHGPSRGAEWIATKLGISPVGPGGLGQVLQHEWFHRSPDNTVTLTDKGDRAVI